MWFGEECPAWASVKELHYTFRAIKILAVPLPSSGGWVSQIRFSSLFHFQILLPATIASLRTSSSIALITSHSLSGALSLSFAASLHARNSTVFAKRTSVLRRSVLRKNLGHMRASFHPDLWCAQTHSFPPSNHIELRISSFKGSVANSSSINSRPCHNFDLNRFASCGGGENRGGLVSQRRQALGGGSGSTIDKLRSTFLGSAGWKLGKENAYRGT